MNQSVRCLLFVAVSFLSLLGEGMAVFALTLEAADQFGSWGVTALFLAGLLPPIFVASLVGRWVDGSALWRVWITNLFVHILIFAVMAVLESMLLCLILMPFASICAVINGSVIFKIMPSLRGGFSVARASSFLVVATSLSGIIAPAIASWIFAGSGLGAVLWCGAIGFGLLSLVALVMRWSLREAASGSDRHLQDAPHEPLGRGSVLFGNGRLRLLILPVAAIVLFTSAEGVSGVFYLRGITADDTGYALLLGAWSLGAVLGSLLGGNSWFAVRGSTPILLGGALVGAAILVEGLWPNVAVLMFAFLVGGMANGLHNTGVRTAIYQCIPPERHGIAWAQLRMLINGMVALGYLLGTPGLVMDSAQMIIIVSGAGSMAAVLIPLVLIRNYGQRKRQNAPEMN